MQRGHRLALTGAVALAALVAISFAFAQRADAITPTIANNGADSWAESLAIPGEDTGNILRVTLLVRHDPGLAATGAVVDTGFDGTPDTFVSATNQQPVVINGFNYSRITVTRAVTYGGFGCISTNPTRRTDRTIAVRARLSDGSETANVSRTVWTVADGQCTGFEDYPFIFNQSQTLQTVAPGGSVGFTFRGDDPDTGDCRDFGGYTWRVRRLNDGAIVSGPTRVSAAGDNTDRTLNVTFQSAWGRGRYVVEAEALNDYDPDDGIFDVNSCTGPNNVSNDTTNPNPGKFFWLGAVDVNGGSPSGTLGLTTSTPKRNDAQTATLSGLADASGDLTGGVQLIEWDADGDNTYERREYQDPVGTAFTTAQLTQAVNTNFPKGTPRTVRARITDTGAMNAADNLRKQTVLTQTFTVANTPPVVNDQELTTNAGTAVPVDLAATDGDGDSLTYSIQSPSPDGSITGGTTDDPTFTPNANFAGQTQFTAQVSDGTATDTAVIKVNVRPETSIDSSPPALTNDNTQEITFSSPQAASGVTFECSIDSTSSYSACTSGQTFTFTDGSHTFRVRAVKGSLVDPTPEARTFAVDATAPDTDVIAGPPAYDGNTTAGFTFSSTETPATFECNLDGNGYTPCPAASFIPVTQGSHTLLIRSTDSAGNTDPTPKSYTWFMDPFRPDTYLGTPLPLGTTNNNDAAFTFVGVDPADPDTGVPGSGVQSYRCELTGPAPSTTDPCVAPQPYTDLPDGTHTFKVAARDQVGLDPTPAEYTWTIDTVAPSGAAITSGPPTYTNDTTPTFQVGYSGAESNIGVECSLDSPTGPYTNCGANYTINVGSEGEHKLYARAYDPAGNRENPPAVHVWNLDTTPPVVQPVTSPPVQSTSRDATVEFTSNEPTDATYTCSVDNATATSCTSPVDLTNLSDGPHSVAVKTTDRSGNESADPYTFAWVVDATPPTGTQITAKPDDPSNTSAPSFSFANTTTPDLASFECRIDSTNPADWTPCTSPQTYTGLSDTPHTFEVRAVDNFGNRETTPQTYTWSIDTVAPDTSFDTQPPAFTNAASAPFDLASDESPVTYECKLPGSGVFQPCSEVFSLTLPEGDYTVEARAVDAANNRDVTPASATFTVDRTAPETTIDDGPSGFESSTTGTFQFSSDEPGTFECRLDGGAYAPCSTGEAFTGLAQGSHTVDIRAFDRAGNVDQTPASRTWTVDTVDPSASITGKPASLSNTRDPQFTFSSDEDPNVDYTCTLDGTDAPCTTPKTYTGLADGSHTFSVKATDRAGNSSPQDSYTWDLDATPPTGTTIDSGPSGTVGVPTAVLTFSNPESGVTLECKLDGAAFATCSGPQTLSNLAEGSHTFSVRAKDPAGNYEVTPATRTWTVDLTGPDTTLSDGPSGTTGTGAASFAFSASEGNVSYQCSLDGSQWEPCTSRTDYADVGNGGHTFRVRARDAVGNVDPSPAERSWTVAKPSAPAEVKPQPKPVDPCTFRGLAPGCEDTRAGAKLIVAGKGGDTTASTAGSPELATASLTLRSGAKIKVASALGGKEVGSFSLADRRGTTVKTGKLKLPRKPKGTITLFSASGLTITLSGQTVTLTGLPRNVYRVAITLNGQKTGVLVPSKPCSALNWRAVLTDRLGAKQTIDAKGTCPPTAGAKR